MPARWKTGLALVAFTMAGAIAGRLEAEPLTAQAVVARCASQADAKLTGISALDEACPGVRAALDQLRLTALLPPGWRKALTSGELADLAALAQRYGGSAAAGAPRAATLRSIAAGLVPPPPPPTWSDRIRALIQHWTGPLLRGVERWLRSLGPALRHPRGPRAIFYGLIALLLLTVTGVLAFELRGSGLVRALRRAERLPRRQRSAAAPAETDAAQFGEPDWVKLREQPAGLLRLLVDTLTRAHRLERDRHLTCRELETQARFDSEGERAGFARVARLAERELYGPPGASVLSEDVLHDAQVLHSRLSAAAGLGGNNPQ